MTLHIVKREDTLSAIARMHGANAASLAAANQLGDGSRLPVGQALVAHPGGRPGRHILVHGCVPAGIGDSALYGALPYLTYLTPYAYRLRPDGELSEIGDSALVRIAYANDTAPLMAVTCRQEGSGQAEAVHALLGNAAIRNALLCNLRSALLEGSYMGLVVDFSGLDQADGPAYGDFLQQLRERLAPEGYLLAAALCAGDSHAYAAAGNACDLIILLSGGPECAYAPPRPVSPIGEVEEMLQSACVSLPAARILLGMPGWGYNWTLPFSPSRPAQPVALADVPDLAFGNYANILYDADAQAPYFQYYDSNGAEHMVWFHDPRSIQARLRLVETFGLAGISCWDLSRLYRPGFVSLAGMFQVQKAFD